MNSRGKRLFIVILGACLNFFVLAQAPASFRHLSKKDGLSQASVFAIAQDSTGFMWFGTRDGLNKFDGYRFKVYRKNALPDSPVANDIRTLFFDKKRNELWIGTIAGLSKYQEETDNFLNFRHTKIDSSGLINDRIRFIFRDSEDRLWCGTAGGLHLYNDTTQKFQSYLLSEDLLSNDVKSVLEDRQGRVWFGTRGGLFFLSETKSGQYVFTEAKDLNTRLSDKHIKSLVEDRVGNIWIGTFSGGVNYWDRTDDKVKIFKYEEGNPYSLSHNNVRSLHLDEDDNLWVGGFVGLNYFDKEKQVFKRYKKSDFSDSDLSDNSIRSLFIDERGSLWVGTYYGGINHADKNYNRFTNFKYAPIKNSLSGDVVSSFAEDEEGNIWIGTEGAGLNFYDKKTENFSAYQSEPGKKNALSGNNVKELLLVGDSLWIGTFQGGLSLLNTKTKQFSQFRHNPSQKNSLSVDNVYGLYPEKDFLWILTYGGGLDILDLRERKFYNYAFSAEEENTLSSDNTRVILRTEDNQLWIGTDKGLNKVRRGPEGLPVGFEVLLPDEKIYSLQADKEQNIWIGTFTNGLYKLSGGSDTIVHYTTSEGLPGNSIYGILEAETDEIWLSTNNGLAKFNPKEEKFTNYNYSDGLENSEYNFNAYFKTSDGSLLFGGIKGFTKFDPKNIRPNLYIPHLVFTELKHNNKVVKAGDETGLLEKNLNSTEQIVFDYNEANFTIAFAALDYLSPENNRYSFMLEGIDRERRYTSGEASVSYTIQREGAYLFKVRAGNSDGLWSLEERQILIKVLPPPYRSWWAYLLYFVGSGIVVFGLVRHFILQQNLRLEKVAKQQQEELHEAKLRFFTDITHEFRTPLTLILGPLRDLRKKEKYTPYVDKQLSLMEQNIRRLLNLVNQILTFRKLATDHEFLKVAEYDIVEFLKEIFLSFQEPAALRNIAYSFESNRDEIQVWFDQDKLEKVFFNLFSNAFKFTPDGGEISMCISEKETHVEIKVQDNGPGIAPENKDQIFKRFYEKSDFSQSMLKGTGIGLSISKQMVELHQGQISVKNTSEQELWKGATFIIRLPKGKAHFNAETKFIKPVESKTQKFTPDPVSPHLPVLTPESNSAPEDAPVLLIVEDNPELRAYIRQIFTEEYHILTAENGKAGLKQIKKKTPDLIISDVMMPEMDGIEFCRLLRSDVKTSHIPIILLTARTASMFKIEGLKTGADDYVTKPFDPEELRLRVSNIIQSRQEARDKFARVITLDPKEITVSSADEIFLETAFEIIEKHIDNYEYNVNQLAFDLAISRPLLFTKIKALTGQTPNTFIKTTRLKRAAQLLKTQKLNISEVAYRVGFKDPKYFRKCFKEQFKLTPSEFSKRNGISAH